MLITIFSLICAFSLLFFVLFLIYKGKLKEQYSILWIMLSLAILFFTFFRNSLDDLADLLGVYYAPSLLFMLAFLTILIVLIQMSVAVSGMKDQIRALSQEIGLLKNKIRKKKDR